MLQTEEGTGYAGTFFYVPKFYGYEQRRSVCVQSCVMSEACCLLCYALVLMESSSVRLF